MIRQGDVQLIRIEELPDALKKLDRKELAHGGGTGHAHRIDVGELFETEQGELYLKVSELAHVSNEEHKDVVLKPGNYKIVVKRQYTQNGWEAVHV